MSVWIGVHIHGQQWTGLSCDPCDFLGQVLAAWLVGHQPRDPPFSTCQYSSHNAHLDLFLVSAHACP